MRIVPLKERYQFPAWSGPIVGLGVGGIVGLQMMEARGDENAMFPLLAGLCGALAGCLLWIAESPTGEHRPATIFGSVLAVLAILLCLVPFVGLVVGFPAYFLNRRVGGWRNAASRLGLSVGIVLAVVVFVAFQMR